MFRVLGPALAIRACIPAPVGMHPAVRSAKAGRIGHPVNYGPRENVMPPPPAHAKEIHDIVDLESTADPLGKRLPITWDRSTGSIAFAKFSREVSHKRLDNICTTEHRINEPNTRALQCWYFPRAPKKARSIGAKAENTPKIFKIQRPSRFFARPEMWGAWNVSTETASPRERERTIRRNIKDDQKNSERYYQKHVDTITGLRKMHERGEKPKKGDDIQIYIDHLRKRKEDIEAVLNLDALGQSFNLDGWDSSSMSLSSGYTE